jgi:hypothetical protein
MNTKIIAVVIASALIASCSSVNKTTSTPNGMSASASATDAGYDKYENYQNSNDDQYLRMKVQNQSLWGTIDDYSYWNNSQYDFASCSASTAMLLSPFYNPYAFGNYPFGYYGGFGYGFGWNSWYSPYQTIVLYKNPTVYFNPANIGRSSTPTTAYKNIYTKTNIGSKSASYNTSGRSINSASNGRTYSPAPATRSISNFSGATRSIGGGFSGGGMRGGGGGGRH